MMTDGIEWPAACNIVAYFGDDAVGVVGVEPKIDAALIRSLYVDESMRRARNRYCTDRGGAQGRATRGARHLYLFTTDAGEFSTRCGFEPADVGGVMSVLAGAPQVEHYRARPEEFAVRRLISWIFPEME